MAARKRSRSSRGGGSGKLALKIGLVTGIAGFVASVVVGVIAAGKAELAGGATGEELRAVVTQAYTVAIITAVVAGLAVGGAAFAAASGVANRLTDLYLAVSKLGRGTKTAVRVQGNDEVGMLGRALSALASDMAGQSEEGADGAAVDFDPKIRAYRDKALPEDGFAAPAGFEIDAAFAAGSRGGTDYFGGEKVGDVTVMFLVSAIAANAISAIAVRLARDEIVRALGAGANARKALAHTNRILHKTLPKGVGVTATLLEVGSDSVKVYQAGARVPVLLCSAGELEDLTGDGLALGLDAGPVFEKGLRSNLVQMKSGMRIVVVNAAGNRNDDFVASIQDHSPKHTAPFMNMVLGELEESADAGGLREDVVLMTVKRS